MAEKTLENTLGAKAELRIGNTVIDLYPIRLKDWPEASKLMYLMNFESLADVAYVDGLEAFDTLLRICARSKELENTDHFEVLSNMVDADFKWAKALIAKQNDIDLERLMDRLSKISGKPKNVPTPTSQLPTE